VAGPGPASKVVMGVSVKADPLPHPPQGFPEGLRPCAQVGVVPMQGCARWSHAGHRTTAGPPGPGTPWSPSTCPPRPGKRSGAGGDSLHALWWQGQLLDVKRGDYRKAKKSGR